VKKFGGRNEIWQDRQLLHFFSGCVRNLKKGEKLWNKKKLERLLIHDKEREKKWVI
jgi:hypothetical protein